MNPTFSYLTDVYFEAGAIRCIPELLVRFAIRRPLVVTDPGLVERGLTSLPGLMGMPVFDGVRTNPTEAQVLSALKVYRDEGCDGLVALGGGSPIDLAKCVGILVHHSEPLASYALLNGGVSRITDRVPPLIAIPTTAGSGSEVGRAALATLTSGEKMGFLSPHVLPKTAVCDPELTLSMPPGLTAGTGMDAISHCVETFCSTRTNPIADAIALDGLERGCAFLERAVQAGDDLEARTEMMLCSLEGGLAFQKSLGAVHSLSHPLGGLDKGLHHGTLNGLFLPAVLRFNADFCAGKFDEMARRLGVVSGSMLADYFEALNQRLGLPRTLTEMGVTAEDLEPLAARAAADHCTPTNPRPLDEAACRALYHSLL
ncbi:MAG: iron-containing alcohol dehydrogenase [bacterium]|nr:iron-containing alcohol dehydrogenase [bacterium]